MIADFQNKLWILKKHGCEREPCGLPAFSENSWVNGP